MRRIIAVVVSLVALAIVASTAVGQTDSAPAPVTPVEPQLRNGCKQLFTQSEHRHYARPVYQRDKISRAARKRLRIMRHCQHSDKAERSAVRFERKKQRERRTRARRLCGNPACNRRLMRHMAYKRYKTHGAFNCLHPIINQESGYVVNISFGGRRGYIPGKAYGIPQALPGSKMSVAGHDWQYNPKTQIRWLFMYVDTRYGGPCGALAYKRANGTY